LWVDVSPLSLVGADLFFPLVMKVLDQHKKLEAEEEAAGEALESLQVQLSELQAKLSEAVNRLSRIRRTKSRMKERSEELVRRGMQELDEEDGVVNDLQQLGVPNDVDWPSLGVGLEFADLGPLIPQSEETSLSAPGS